MTEKKNAYSVLVENLEGKKQLRRPRRKWEDKVVIWIEFIWLGDRDQ